MTNNSQTDQPNNKISRITKSILIAIFAIIVVALIQNFSDIDFIEMFRPGTKIERVREKMKKELKEKYGQKFVVDRIGTRSSRGDVFYQARVYPNSIVGTKKEGDDYYYASATVDKLPFGRLGEVGDSYPLVKLKLDIEEYLKPKMQELFGKRILTKIEAHYKKREPGNETFWGQKVNGFEAARDSIKKDPENRMIELELYLYIFDRIDSKQEKEKRRKDIFEFVQYLKEEGLFEYLEMGVIFIDERVLAPSYEEYEHKIHDREWITKEVDGETIELPPKNFRRKMSQELQEEIDRMSEKRLIETMQGIRKSRLTYDGIREYNGQYQCWIYSLKMLKENYASSITEEDKNRNYDVIEDVTINDYKKYIFIN